jgi:hypothetical protein
MFRSLIDAIGGLLKTSKKLFRKIFSTGINRKQGYYGGLGWSLLGTVHASLSV